MKSPLWILNLSLLVLCFCTIAYIALTPYPRLKKAPLQVTAQANSVKQELSTVNIARIYESDLFDTFKKVAVDQPTEEEKNIIAIPQPPQPKPVFAPAPQPPAFIAPLNVTLKGIIIDKNEIDSYAILSNNATIEEHLYKTGSVVEDAHIIKIARDKVIVIRSNGQQETLFITPERLKKESYFVHNKTWGAVVQKINNNNYVVDPENFVDRIKTLSNIISLFDLTTAFNKGQSIGCRIGSRGDQSLSSALGFEYGDVIIAIDNLPLRTTKERVEAYGVVVKKTMGATIAVKIARGTEEKTIVYTTAKFEEQASQEKFVYQDPLSKRSVGSFVNQEVPINRERVESSKQIIDRLTDQGDMSKTIKREQKKIMLEHGGKEQFLTRNQLSNP